MFFHERGEIRDASFESQAFRASALNLVVSAIIRWNTVYLARAVDQLRAEGHDLPDEIVCHVSPQIREHITLTGTYDWNHQDLPPGGAFRPLRGSRPKPEPLPDLAILLLCSPMSDASAQFL